MRKGHIDFIETQLELHGRRSATPTTGMLAGQTRDEAE
jgi:hypothetical protein